MRRIIILFLLSIVAISTAQNFSSMCINKYHTLHVVEVTEYVKQFDFSPLFRGRYSKFNLGYIGDNYRRIRVKFTKTYKDDKIPALYHIEGKSNVKNNICNFKGKLVIDSILIASKPYLGLDNMYEDSSIAEQGMIVGHYELLEDSTQKFAGKFVGKLMCTWFRKTDGLIQYDIIESFSDRWCNSQFIGKWIPYNKSNEKVCVWGQGRLYDPLDKLDVGTGEFYPAKEYHSEGWESIIEAYYINNPSEEAKKIENSKWWEK